MKVDDSSPLHCARVVVAPHCTPLNSLTVARVAAKLSSDFFLWVRLKGRLRLRHQTYTNSSLRSKGEYTNFGALIHLQRLLTAISSLSSGYPSHTTLVLQS